MKVKNQRGSASVIALCLVLVLTIMSAGVAFMMNTEGKLATENKDLIEAKYAAEAGAKRAIIEFEKINDSQTPSWTWLGTDKPLVADTDKKYNVKIYNKSDTTFSTPVTPSASSNGTYTIVSTGNVNGTSKRILLDFKIEALTAPSNPAYVGDTAFYSDKGADISVAFFNGNTIDVNGASSYTVGETYAAHNEDAISYDSGYKKVENIGVSLGVPGLTYDSVEKKLTVGTEIYDFSNPVIINDSTTTINFSEIDNKCAAMKSSLWTVNSSNVVVNGSGVIFVNGNVLFSSNNTGITCSDSNGALLVINGNLSSESNNKITLKNVAVLVFGDVTGFKNSFQIDGTLIAKGSMTFKNNATFNYNALVANTWTPTTANGGNPGGTGTSPLVAKIVDKSWKLL